MIKMEKKIIQLNNVNCSYNNIKILENINLDIFKGCIQVIIGPSGSGKTSLLKLINGLIISKKGNIKIEGKKLNYSNLKLERAKIGYIPQHLGLIKSMTVKDNILLGSLSRTKTLNSLFKIFSNEDQKFAKHLIRMVGLKKKENKKIFYLSGGEKRRVAIARAFMQRPKIILADEILSDLDFDKVNKIITEIKRLKNETNVTIVMVEHDLTVAMNIGDKIAILRDGKIKNNFNREDIDNSIIFKHFTK